MQNGKKGKKKFFVIGALALLIIVGSVSAGFYYKGKSTVMITETKVTAIEQEQEIPITSEQKLDFTVTSSGRGRLSTFDIAVLTTDGRKINLGDFSVALRQIEQIGPHDARFENFVDYYIPENWNSSQKLTETITVKETTKEPVRAMIANEPLFTRGVDYPKSIPFSEVEIQVDSVNYYTDVNETEYIAWLRIRENETLFDIKKIMIEGYDSDGK